MNLSWLWPALTGRARAEKPSRADRTPSAQKMRLSVETLEDRLAPAADIAAYESWRNATFQVDDAVVTQVASSPVPSVQSMESSSLIGLDKVRSQYSAYTGSGYSVAVLDTGIDYNNPALGGGWGNRVVAGWDFANDDSDPMDDQGHGTHVAGIIGSSDANYQGVAPDVNLIALKVLSGTGSGSFGDVEDALKWVIAHQAEYNIVAINLSLGSGNYTVNPYTFLDDEFAALKAQGVFLAVAAGNSYYSFDSTPGLGFPAISSQVAAVGAVWTGDFGRVVWASGAIDNTTGADRVASFTQRGTGLDILAPGAMITSTYLNNTWQLMAGTSMASPVVAGAAAILHQAMDATGKSSVANQDGILALMQQTGKNIYDGDDENDNVINSGLTFKRLDLFAALQSLAANPNPNPTTNHAPTLAAIPDQSIKAVTIVTLQGSDVDGDSLTYSAVATGGASQYYTLKTQYGLQFAGSYFQNQMGSNEKWLLGNGSVWYTLLPNGEMRKWLGNWENTLASGGLIATLSPDVYANPELLWNAAAPSGAGVSLIITGNQLRITPPSGFVGSFQVEVTVSDGKLSAKQSFKVTVGNSAPVLAAIPDVTLAQNQTSAVIGLSATDADGDKLTYSASVLSGTATVSAAQQLSIKQWLPAQRNRLGLNEQWFKDVNNTQYYLLPTGKIYRWGGSIASSKLVDTLSTAYYTSPSLLLAAATASPSVSLSGNQLTVRVPTGWTGSFSVQVVVSDGTTTATRTFKVTTTTPAPVNSAPTLAAVPDQQMSPAQGSLKVNLSASDADGDALTYSAALSGLSLLAVQTQKQYGLAYMGGYYEDNIGLKEKWLVGSSGALYFILPNGELRRWAGAIDTSLSATNLVATFDASYAANPARLTNPVQPTFSFSGSQLTITPPTGATGAFEVTVTVSDGKLSASRTFNVSFSNQAPTLTLPATSGTVTNGQTYSLNVTTSDPEGAAVTLTATATSQAYALKQQLGLAYMGSYFQNQMGKNEKWLLGTGSVFYVILPNGELRRWGGSMAETLKATNLIATLPTSYYTDPSLLLNAKAANVTIQVVGSQLRITPPAGFVGVLTIDITASDGTLKTTKTFTLTVV